MKKKNKKSFKEKRKEFKEKMKNPRKKALFQLGCWMCFFLISYILEETKIMNIFPLPKFSALKEQIDGSKFV